MEEVLNELINAMKSIENYSKVMEMGEEGFFVEDPITAAWIMDQTITIDQDSHMTLSEFNEIEPIEIPQDVLDTATEVSEDELMGGGF